MDDDVCLVKVNANRGTELHPFPPDQRLRGQSLKTALQADLITLCLQFTEGRDAGEIECNDIGISLPR
ncbi:hypothetical protein [Labrys sp. ZIDIC5]|uniref:hypothetical protein n=1 Tax=Labrys sedimenti TaxID=3106036 RepID=UPI002ACA2BEF|nr:hypothetical protein [Labrys sp. ZIDIC5]MDZ5453178.1 hypothetical protein [Labrys sp. ZIDIC5]